MSFIGRILQSLGGPRKHNPRAAADDGAAAEALAAAFLGTQGVRIIARNYRVRGGEIDLVGEEGNSLVFVEVRLRRNRDYGGAAASITPRKQQRIILAARHWLAAHPREAVPCRFDCVLLDGLDATRMEWIRNAFAAD